MSMSASILFFSTRKLNFIDIANIAQFPYMYCDYCCHLNTM